MVDKYLSGESISKISKENDIPYAKVEILLYKNGVNIRGGRSKILTEKDEKDICEKYNLGISMMEISREYKVDYFTVKLALIKNGINVGKRKYRYVNKTLKEDYFDIIDSEEKAYYLGLMLTDGSVNSKRLRLSLKAEDKYVLDKFRDELGVENLYYDNRCSGLYSLEVNSKHLVKSLNKYGVIENKTYLLKEIPFENIPREYMNHFIRGIFDGDGSITYSEKWKYRIFISEYSYSLVEQIRNKIDDIISRDKHTKIQKASCYFCNWHKKQDIKDILDYIYNNATIYLVRKHNRYLSFLEYYKTYNKDIV